MEGCLRKCTTAKARSRASAEKIGSLNTLRASMALIFAFLFGGMCVNEGHPQLLHPAVQE